MSLTILSSNRVETLQSRLAQELAAAPPPSPFAPEIVVVPTFAMARWLNLRIAQQQGIAANINYHQPGEWVWSLAGAILGDGHGRDPYTGAALGWRLFEILPRMLGQPAFRGIGSYLDEDHSGIKRWQLAQRIAGCFDRYQAYRPQMIRGWSAGEEHHWQARLWREAVDSAGQAHRVELIDRLVACLNDESLELDLPARISMFAISSLPPYLVELVHALANRTEITLYQHSPTNHYWADLVSTRQKARKRLQDPIQAEYLDVGNSLLASWGRQGQAMQDLLLDIGSSAVAEVEDNRPPGADSLLQCLQSSLFELVPPRRSIDADDSLTVNICHSPLRECQVLHDHLLGLLDRNPDLACEDILVMVPEISRYAPYIEAVFQHDGSSQRPTLGWNISDISVSDGNPLVQAFLQLLKLPSSRFARSEILGFLECPEIRYCFGIRPEMHDEILSLVEAARVRWGIDARHREDLGLPATHENTWQQAWERFFAGYAMPSDELWRGIAPIAEFEGESAEALSRFRYLFERLTHWQKRLSKTTSAANWQQQLHQLVDEFFTPRSVVEDQLLPLRNAISELGESGAVALTPSLVSYWMEKQFATNQQAGRLYSGGITFCGMQPMRNIPFPVICVLGMQDTAFPRRENPPEFDLMQQQWRPGDPRKGDQDRYLMLETLLCARRHLYFSYCGRSLKDNSECQPSVLLRELLDYIDSNFDSIDSNKTPAEELTRIHPMQAFSGRNFEPRQPGYDGYWHDAAMQLQRYRAPEADQAWSQQPLGSTGQPGASVGLETLIRFYSHPIRFFFNSRLGISMPSQDRQQDEESFGLQGLEKWELATRLAEDIVSDQTSDVELFAAQGLLPHGMAAQSEWLELQQDFQPLLARLQHYRGLQAAARPVDCEIGDGMALTGQVGACYPGTGLMHFTASKSVKSRALLTLWLQHLALCAAGKLAEAETSQLITAQDNGVRYRRIAVADARTLLSDYFELFRLGLQFPLPVFPDTSYAWARETDPEQAMKKAIQAWQGGLYRGAPPGEREDELIRLALHNNSRDPLKGALFRDCAIRIYRPAIEQDKSS